MKWYKHDATANLDEKLQEVLLDYGYEGYGLYWYCLELIAFGVDSDNLTFELKHDSRILARNGGSSVARIEEIMKKFISIGLFEGDADGRITCLKLAKRADDYTSKVVKNASIELRRKLKQNNMQLIENNESPTKSDNLRERPPRIEKNRIEKNKGIADGFALFWSTYPKKKNKGQARKVWLRLKPSSDLQTKILEQIEQAKRSDDWRKESGKYIPYPSTWLNAEGWEDEDSGSSPITSFAGLSEIDMLNAI